MKLIVGCGYLGMRIARRWLATEEPVAAVTRHARRAEEFRATGILPVIAEVTQPDSLEQLRTLLGPGDTLLYAVGYDRSAGKAMDEVYVQGLQNILAAIHPEIGRVIYISSTGVYGQVAGESIDEDSLTEPTREGGRVCLAAERALLDSPFGNRALILRLAGIYGPGRVPNRADLLSQKPLPFDPSSALNLIHVEDAATVVLAAEKSATTPRTYVVSDGNPVARGDYYAELARLWNTPAPIFATPGGLDPQSGAPVAAPRRGGADKRIDPTRLRRELAPVFQYPDYRTGLRGIIELEQQQQ
jgi:nucleoside-diphosphate-sugar epimerase